MGTIRSSNSAHRSACTTWLSAFRTAKYRHYRAQQVASSSATRSSHDDATVPLVSTGLGHVDVAAQTSNPLDGLTEN